MPLVPVPLSSGYYVDETQTLSDQECVNLYPAIPETVGALTQNALRSPAGIVQAVADLGVGTGRGAIVMNDQLYVVIGPNLYLVNDDNTTELKGQNITGTNRVALAENDFVITIVVPGTTTGYFYTRPTSSDPEDFSEITDPVYVDYGVKLDVTYKDGFFVYITPDEFFLSSLVIENLGRDFNALDFSTAEVSTDSNVAVETIRNELYIFGERSIEVFQNTGATFPFQRIPGATVDRGCLAAFTAIPFQNSYMFVGAGKNEGISIWQGLSGSSQRISTTAIDDILQNLPVDDVRNAFAWRYSESGNFFIGFTVPGQITLVYDQTTSQAVGRPVWHRRSSSSDGVGAWRPSDVVQAYGRLWVIDSLTGRIGNLDINTFTEYGENVLRRFHTVYMYNQGNRFNVSEIELKTQLGITGFGVTATPGNVGMSVSVDGGQTWEPEQPRRLPTSPSDTVRSIWYRQGKFNYSAALRFDVLDPNKIAHIACTAIIDPGG